MDAEDEAARMLAGSALDINLPCMLLARFGENTWGHWVTEMLAKAAIAERLLPGRFFYAVPWWTTEPGNADGLADAVLSSLAAYGIMPDRLVRLSSSTVFRFEHLHDIAGFFADGLHPGALESLRRLALPKAKSSMPRRIVLLRRPPLARTLFNEAAVLDHLRSERFSLVGIMKLSFVQQARLFAEAEIVAGSLGSDFWATLFSPEGAPLVSLAPAAWEDGYFIRLFQRIGARHADLRGPSIPTEGAHPAQSQHVLDATILGAAIEAVQRPEAAESVVDGEIMPRRLGREKLSLDFGTGGNAASFIRGAWSAPEVSHCWSLGASSEIVLPALDQPCWLEIEGHGHVYPPHMPTRPLTILANGAEAGRFELVGRTRLFCPIAATDGPLMLGFLHPICPSPRAMGGGPDDRPLGFGFERLCLHARA